MDHVEEDIIICFICDDRLIYGEQWRDIDEGVVCSLYCDNKYLEIDQDE